MILNEQSTQLADVISFFKLIALVEISIPF